MKLTLKPFNIKSTKLFKSASKFMYRHGSKIMIVLGIGCGIGAAVEVYKAAKAEDEALSVPYANLENVRIAKEEMTEPEYRKELVKAYVKIGVTLGKLYWPAVTLGMLSTTSILGAYGILADHLTKCTAAYAMMEEGYREYRSRVVSRFGKEVDSDIVRGDEVVAIDVPEFDKKGNPKLDKDGVAKSHQEDVKMHTKDPIEVTAWRFDEYCANYLDGSPQYNANFLLGVLSSCEMKLRSDLYVTENDVRKAIGAPRTSSGDKNIWTYDPLNPKLKNTIDVGIYKTLPDGTVTNEHTEAFKAFEKGEMDHFWLEFNTDGVIDDIAPWLYGDEVKVVKQFSRPKLFNRILPGKVEVYA